MADALSTSSASLIIPASAPLIFTLSSPPYRNPGTTTAIKKAINATLGIEEKEPGGAVEEVLIIGLDLFASFEYQDWPSGFFPFSLSSLSLSYSSKFSSFLFKSSTSSKIKDLGFLSPSGSV
jgi:hypothetical protein